MNKKCPTVPLKLLKQGFMDAACIHSFPLCAAEPIPATERCQKHVLMLNPSIPDDSLGIRLQSIQDIVSQVNQRRELYFIVKLPPGYLYFKVKVAPLPGYLYFKVKVPPGYWSFNLKVPPLPGHLYFRVKVPPEHKLFKKNLLHVLQSKGISRVSVL